MGGDFLRRWTHALASSRVQYRVRYRPTAILLLSLSACASSPSPSTAFGVYEPPVVAPQAPPPSTPKPAVVHYASPREFGAALRFIEAVVELERVRKAHPDRHEATYNEAILLQEYGTLLEGEHHEAVYRAASRLYRLFIQQASSDPDASDQVYRAKERVDAIDSTTMCDFGISEAERKTLQQEEKQRAAEAEINKP